VAVLLAHVRGAEELDDVRNRVTKRVVPT
jgi:hypothetical protein